MSIGPLTFTNPWGLLGLLSLPVIVGIHLFRQQYKPEMVSALFLWQHLSRTGEGHDQIDRPPLSRSLLFELLAAFLISLLLGMPGFTTGGNHHIVLIDNSGSMEAQLSDGSLMDRAREQVFDHAENWFTYDRVSVFQTSPGLRRVGPEQMPLSEARNIISNMEPVHTSTDYESILKSVSGFSPTGDIVLVTDHEPERERSDLPPALIWYSVGTSLDNIALTRARRQRGNSGERSEIYLEITNYSSSPGATQIELSTADTQVTSRRIELNPGESRLESFAFPRTDQPANVRLIHQEDALPLDNNVSLLPEINPEIRVSIRHISSRAESIVRKGLTSIPSTKTLRTDDETPDLIIGPYDQTPLPSFPITYFGLRTTPDDSTNGNEESDIQVLTGPYTVNRNHPLTRDVYFDGVQLAGVNKNGTEMDGLPLIISGNIPILYEQTGSRSDRFFANFQLPRSNLHRVPAFPIMLTNIIQIVRDRLPGVSRSNWRVDEPVVMRPTFRTPADVKTEYEWRIQDPTGEMHTIQSREPIRWEQANRIGRYVLERENTENSSITDWPFRVHFLNPTESDLRGRTEGSWENPEHSPDRQETVISRDRLLQTILFLSVLVVLLFHWFYFE